MAILEVEALVERVEAKPGEVIDGPSIDFNNRIASGDSVVEADFTVVRVSDSAETNDLFVDKSISDNIVTPRFDIPNVEEDYYVVVHALTANGAEPKADFLFTVVGYIEADES